tara:strand:- start:151 stop:531 length:381 start_codon:yes stop_codon:yes gene_type:complete
MWGQHLILDLTDCDRTAIKSPDTIRQFSNDLVNAIDMKPFGDPLLEHFATHDPQSGGYTLVQLIETSNITAHFAEQSGDVYLDVFSCRAFSEKKVIEVCEKYFSPRYINKTSLARGIHRPTVTNAA